MYRDINSDISNAYRSIVLFFHGAGTCNWHFLVNTRFNVMFAKREILNTDVHKTRDFLVRYLRSETKYLPQNCVLWQKVIYYDKQHELNFYPNTFIFFKNIFLNSDSCKMYWEIFKKKYNIKSDHFLSHFTTRNS